MNTITRVANLNATDALYLLKKKLSRSNILLLLQPYGFIECANIMSFLQYVCETEDLERSAHSYIYSKIVECLSNHDVSDSANCEDLDYFKDLKSLRNELEFFLSIY